MSISTMSPSLSSCACFTPWGKALASPNSTMQKVEPGAPTLRCAWWMNSATSAVLMPSRRMLAAALCTSRVMSLARCISASSVADLWKRQGSMTQAALTNSKAAPSRRMPSYMKKATDGQRPMRASAAMPMPASMSSSRR
ncbi:hypothetical protein D9M73_225890 [compost metagenome]